MTEPMQWTGDNADEMRAYLGEAFHALYADRLYFFIEPGRVDVVTPGRWIMRLGPFALPSSPPQEASS